MTRTALLCLLLLAALPWQPAGAGQLYYRYTDAQGNPALGFVVPPEAMAHGYQVVDGYGRVVRDVPPPKTAEELAELQRQQQERQEQERIARDRAAADRKLLQSYSREDDLILARDANLSSIDDQLRLSHMELDRLSAQLERQRGHAAGFERSGESVPPSVRADLERTRQQMANQQKYLKERENQRGELESEFNRELIRYRELKALPEAERRALLNPPPPPSLPVNRKR